MQNLYIKSVNIKTTYQKCGDFQRYSTFIGENCKQKIISAKFI